jgi:hypothetical protein
LKDYDYLPGPGHAEYGCHELSEMGMIIADGMYEGDLDEDYDIRDPQVDLYYQKAYKVLVKLDELGYLKIDQEMRARLLRWASEPSKV